MSESANKSTAAKIENQENRRLTLESSNADVSAAKSSPPAVPLTPEEQMALYEKDLKENDWGHQPC